MPDVIGTIMTNEEANETYGEVQSSVSMSSSQLSSLSGQTKNLMMFKIIEDRLYILGDSRAVLYPSGGSVDSSEVFAVYSKSKVLELLQMGENSTTFIEKRKEVYSLTNGQYTLEIANWCPPYCGQQ